MTVRDSHLAARCAEVDVTLQDAMLWSAANPKLGAHLASYLVVLLCGVLEDCFEHLVRKRVGKLDDQEVASLVDSLVLDRFRNPDYSQITGFLRSFSDRYADQFKARVPQNHRSAKALESIFRNKNSLAHTGTMSFQVTLSDVTEYYAGVTVVLEALEDILA